MKKILLIVCCSFFALQLFSQKQWVEFVSYVAPKGWTREEKKDYVSLVITNQKKQTYCRITIFKSINSTGGVETDFEQEWKSLVATVYKTDAKPEVTAPEKKGEWTWKSGIAPFSFNNGNSAALLTTITGHGKLVSIVTVTNTVDYQKIIEDFHASVDLKKPEPDKLVNNQTSTTPVAAGKFAFTTTNFDNGWTSTVHEDWVQVAKGSIRVLIHYPNKVVDDYNPSLMNSTVNAWNILVAPRYSDASNMDFKPISYYESVEFAEADVIERATGKKVHVVLFKKNRSGGTGKYLEFITPDKTTFEQQFGAWHPSPSEGWDQMENMAGYNKFAVAASDLQGKWSSNFSSSVQYVNAVTGNNAGIKTYGANEDFSFSKDGTYSWKAASASGMLGSMKTESAKSAGKFSMNGNWQVKFSDIEGKPQTYDVYFTCVKGLRILWMKDKPFAKIE